MRPGNCQQYRDSLVRLEDEKPWLSQVPNVNACTLEPLKYPEVLGG
jgi:hypothetical protein